MIDFKKELNSEQLNVVLHGDGACLVLAGAGSGKTRTITYRVAYLLEKGVDPSHILLMTFTNKAAKEMTLRVQALTGGSVRLPWSGTFHHVAYRLLCKYAPLLGYEHNFTILDSEDSRDLLKLCMKSEGIDKKEKRFPSVKAIQSILSYARNAELSVESILEDRYPQWTRYFGEFEAVAEEYRKRKLDANAMDFDDLLVNLYLLLIKNEHVKQKFAEQFEYVLVDEYQDTNKIQASIVRLMSSVHKNILVVGDDAQSIYSFRAADIDNILSFEKQYPGANIFRLEQNYRSTSNILEVANGVIAANVDQYQKQLTATLGNFAKPEQHAFVDAFEEASFIAGRIVELEQEGVPLNEIAILFRATHHSQALEVELTKRGIAYDYRGGLRFFERSHIKDVLAYLRIFANTRDTIAWSRILNMQIGIGPATAVRIIAHVQGGGDMGHISDGLSARAKLGWNDFLQVYECLKESDGTPAGLIQALTESKYVDYLRDQHENFEDRLQDIEQLSIFAERQSDLAQFLAEASMQESYARDGSADVVDEDRIVLSTIHQAKGLEWEAVFVMHLVSGQFPNERATKERKGIEEERRLFYVAITRARKYLHFTYPLTARYTSVLLGASMFLEEIKDELLSKYGMIEGNSSGTVFNDPSDDVDDIQYIPEDDEPFSSAPRRSFLKSIDEL